MLETQVIEKRKTHNLGSGNRFKYLGYRITEYKSDLEEKLQTYNKINGAIRRHFGKQMNKETKVRIHNITAKAALKFGSEA